MRGSGPRAKARYSAWAFVQGTAMLAYLRAYLVSHHSLALEATALRQQLSVYKHKQPRPKLERFDRLFWVVLRRLWTQWSEALIIVKPDTVVSWHRAGFRLFWRWRSRQAGRPKVAEEIRQLIRRMRTENPTWGAPRIHGELLLLGFEISEPTVSRYLQGLKRFPQESKAKQWLTFLNKHREVITAFDFFTVPTLSFRTLYCFFTIGHGRRQILHFNVTRHPTSVIGSCSNCVTPFHFLVLIDTSCSTMMRNLTTRY
jgi:putative transposase